MSVTLSRTLAVAVATHQCCTVIICTNHLHLWMVSSKNTLLGTKGGGFICTLYIRRWLAMVEVTLVENYDIAELCVIKWRGLCVNQGVTSRECQVSLAEQERKKQRRKKEKIHFYHHLVQDLDDHFRRYLHACQYSITCRFRWRGLESLKLWVINVFVMYYVYGASGPSLLIESTDSMITAEELLAHTFTVYCAIYPLFPHSVFLTTNWRCDSHLLAQLNELSVHAWIGL